MTEAQRDVVLLSFIQRLKEQDNWCGETHIQKATYLFQELLGVPLGFQFILYKHGPYSFDLKDGLTALLGDGLIQLKPRPPYGPSLFPGENWPTLLQQYPHSSRKYLSQANFVAERVSSLDVKNLERLTTAVLVTRQDLPNGTVAQRATKLHELKPHIAPDDAYDAILEADKLIAAAKAVAQPNS